ncbi:MAG: VUT family protein, partial [Clostridiales bacterium]|nr:VUT family protein [Clostridiales bacterium]
MAKIKEKWGPRRLFVRTISSTAVGQAFDTGIFITLAFWGIMPNDALLTLMLGQYIVKMLIELAVGTPMAYALVGYLKGKGASNVEKPAENASVALEVVQKSEMTIPIMQLPETTVIDEKSLFEITDRTVIARISQTIPAATQTAAKTVTKKAFENAEIYKAVIPKGATLAKSQQMKDAERGFYRGTKGIKGQANFVKITDPGKVTKASAVANSVANVMNVGSLVVGQYYMSEISARLETMSKTVNKISDFQDMEFKGKILSLISRVGEISQFSSEIIENDELRDRKLAVLEDLKGEATKLLGQVNSTITETIKKNPTPNYQEYQKTVEDFNILVEYQNILIAVLEEISKLTYLLGKGHISSDMSYSVYYKFLEQSVHTRNALEKWHDARVKALRIDLDKNRVSKSGPEGFFSAIPAVINNKYDKWKYKELKQGLVQKINTQAQANLKALNIPKEVYDEDVEIIIKDGKYYFLHETSGTE